VDFSDPPTNNNSEEKMRMMRKRPTGTFFALPRLARLLVIAALVACSADELASPDGAADKNAPRPSLALVAYGEDLVSAYDETTGNTYEYRPLDGVLRIIRGYQVFDIELDASTQNRAIDFVLGVAANSEFIAETEGIAGDFPPPQCGNGGTSGCQMSIRVNPQSSSPMADSLGTIVLAPNVLMRRVSQPSLGLTPSAVSLSGSDPCQNIGQAIAAQRITAIAKAQATNSTIDNVLNRVEVEFGRDGRPRLAVPNAGALAMEVVMELAERLTDRTAMNILTFSWNTSGCRGRTIHAGVRQEGQRIQGVGNAGGSSPSFLLVTCVVFTYQISFDGGNSWITTATEVKCTSSHMN
jgi:hypothetical protein